MSPAPLTFLEMKRALQEHQIQRLRESYGDLIADPNWSELGEFFFNELYMVGDRTERNESFLRVYRHFERVFESNFLSGIHALIDFYIISEKLDDDVTRVLMEMGVSYGFSSQDYEKAYRWTDSYDDRVKQL